VVKDSSKYLENFSTFVDHIKMPDMTVVSLFTKTPHLQQHYYQISLQQFNNESVSYLLKSDLTAYANGALAKKCFETAELENVHLYRGTNIINNHDNVWLIRGFKKIIMNN
jgi:hypothetical protein